jgi:hypothetical protein
MQIYVYSGEFGRFQWLFWKFCIVPGFAFGRVCFESFSTKKQHFWPNKLIL